MAREHETTSSSQQQQEQQRWGTLEELLLASAVNRHGIKSWDSVAMEVANRSPSLASLTPESCKDKFRDLKRRFMASNEVESTSLVRLVDQLRQIRVQELRDEVQRRNVSIVSLELKVKRLEEEREKSLKEEEADLERARKVSLEIIAGKFSSADGDESNERENRSFNESNSTTQKAEETKSRKQQKNDVAEGEKEKEPKVKSEPDRENDPVPFRTASEPDRDRDWSSNGKLNGNVEEDDEDEDDVDKDKMVSDKKMETVNKNNKTSGLSESNELWDDSKREGKEVGVESQQSSDVQSSASLSKNKKRRRSSSVEKADAEEVSPAMKKVLAVKSEPLVRFLDIIRSHRLGLHFERRPRSQESETYKKLIRQHIDLQTIQSRLDTGLYSDCFQGFFRDLLLLFNNFIIFVRKSSQEHAAAQELRALVIREMTAKLRKPQTPAVKPKPDQQQQQKPQKELPVALSKPSRASTMVVCGKRSSAKATLETAAGRKGNKKEREIEEKPKVTEKKINCSFVGIEEKGIKKKRSNERSVSRRRNLRTNNKGGGEVKHQYGGNELSSHDDLEVKMEKKEIALRKKQEAASFLKRMKQNSPSEVVENESSDDDDKGEKREEEEGEEEEKESKDNRVEEEAKKRKGKKRDVGKDRVIRSSMGRGVREESRRMKRGVGRPPKRSVAESPPKKLVAVRPLEMTEKRARDKGDGEAGVGGGSTRSRKRTRR